MRGVKLKWRHWLGSLRADPLRAVIARADAARDDRRFDEAANLYGEVLAQRPNAVGLLLQRAHALKEAGDYKIAEKAYLEARTLRLGDPEFALQLGHFYELTDQFAEAESAYREALALKPAWADAERSLAAALDRQAHQNDSVSEDLAAVLVPRGSIRKETANLGLTLHRVGAWETTAWGNRRTLRGVQALRGYYVSRLPIVELRVSCGSASLFRGPPNSNNSLEGAQAGISQLNKAVFNLWINCSKLARGPARLKLRFIDQSGALFRHQEDVVVSFPVPESDYPDSDTVFELDPEDTRSLEEQIRARASMVRSAQRTLFPNGVRSILVLRTDQLGDMVASIPALRRLRRMGPTARIVALTTAANTDFTRTLGLFDELLEIEFPDDPVEQRRLMPLEQQEALRQRLAPYDFDVAIDLAPSNVSRDLLKLSGARLMHGFGGGDWPWLQGHFEFSVRDRWNRLDVAPHSTKALALVEALGTLLQPAGEILRRSELPRSLLDRYQLGQEEFVVLHTGARLTFSRWPHFGKLAERLIQETPFSVVAIDPDNAFASRWPAELKDNSRFRLINTALPFDDFDALLSFAQAMVGNDSGPKHLAALRGTPVVTLFTARINWSDWGQEGVGAIISRRVPCAGCAIFHNVDECGKAFACIRDIGVEEVLSEIIRLTGKHEAS